jgi:hypothetical protein
VRAFDLSSRETADLIAFLKSLTDQAFLTDRRLSNPFEALTETLSQSVFVLRGKVAAVYPDEGSVALSYSEVPGLLAAVKEPTSREFQVCDRGELALLSPGMKIVAGVRKRGNEYVLDRIRKEQASPRKPLTPVAGSGR